MINYNTRSQVLNDYLVDQNNVIKSPGKFEGEMIYSPMFYSAMLDGCGEDLENNSVRFEIETTDYSEFPELAGFRYVTVNEDNNGFFYCRAHN